LGKLCSPIPAWLELQLLPFGLPLMLESTLVDHISNSNRKQNMKIFYQNATSAQLGCICRWDLLVYNINQVLQSKVAVCDQLTISTIGRIKIGLGCYQSITHLVPSRINSYDVMEISSLLYLRNYLYMCMLRLHGIFFLVLSSTPIWCTPSGLF
jgi:hypothetical protein